MLYRFLLISSTAVALAQAPGKEQAPRWQPAWPCTGKEPSFDPAYAAISEASGGQLFLFDRSEAGRSLVLMTATSRHPQTVFRAAGKLDENNREFRVPVDRSIDSLLLSVSLQCMQRITIFGPSGNPVEPEQTAGENHWFRAGRVAIFLKPEPGSWAIRLEGAGPFFLAVQAHTSRGLRAVNFTSGLPRLGVENPLTLTLDNAGPNVRFSMIDASGDKLQPLDLRPLEGRPGAFAGNVIPGVRRFRILAEGIDESGDAFERVDARLLEAGSGLE